MSNLKWRLVIIGVLSLLSVWALFPRDVKTRQRRADGTFYDTLTRRVPLRKGLDLSGGMHLALEVDESKGVIADKSEAIDRALKVVRTRIEGMGVSETVIQKAGNDRIIIDIPGVDDGKPIEHGRLVGGLNWVGVNTRVISAKRPQWLSY